MISPFGVDHGDISKGLKPRHIKAMDREAEKLSYHPTKGDPAKKRYLNRRALAAKAGANARGFHPHVGDSGVSQLVRVGRESREVSRQSAKEISRKYRKQTRQKLFVTEVGDKK